jgi:hypothetical protein
MKTAHVISLSREAYGEFVAALPPKSRFVNVEEWGFTHIWLYDPTGDVIIITPEPIVKLEAQRVEGVLA